MADVGAETPTSSYSAPIDAETQRALAADGIPDKWRVVLPPPDATTNSSVDTTPKTTVTNPVADTSFPAPKSNPDQFKVTLPPPVGSDGQDFRDRLADKVYPGFGRIEDSRSQWRLDYIDSSRCKSGSKFGLCFTMKLP